MVDNHLPFSKCYLVQKELSLNLGHIWALSEPVPKDQVMSETGPHPLMGLIFIQAPPQDIKRGTEFHAEKNRKWVLYKVGSRNSMVLSNACSSIGVTEWLHWTSCCCSVVLQEKPHLLLSHHLIDASTDSSPSDGAKRGLSSPSVWGTVLPISMR